MKSKKLILAIFSVSVITLSCKDANESVNKVTETVEKTVSVQKVVEELGLQYVEEGAQTIITYNEVNAAQQAWCNALVKIGKLKEAGGDYKSFAN